MDDEAAVDHEGRGPWMKLPSEVARKAIASATSSGVPAAAAGDPAVQRFAEGRVLFPRHRH